MSESELKDLLEHLSTLGAIQVEVQAGDLRVSVVFGSAFELEQPKTDVDWS